MTARVLVGAVGAIVLGCKGAGGFTADKATAGTGTITAAAGGMVETKSGDRLVVPPGALAQDTPITLTPIVFASDPALDVLGGVVTEPDGLRFAQPAKLTLKLAVAKKPGSTLMLGEAPGAGVPTEIGEGHALFVVDASGTTATGEIWSFSGKAIMKNCHAGTRDNLLSAWSGQSGRDPASVASGSGISATALDTCELDDDPLQVLLSPYFKVCGELATGESFGADKQALVAMMLAAGRQVVFLFGTSLPRDAATGRYQNMAHSAIAVSEGGRIVIRNQVYITNPQRLTELEATGTTVDMPLSEIDTPGVGLRDMRAGEVLRQLIRQPFTAAERASRPRAWPAVVMFCENENAKGDAGADVGCPMSQAMNGFCAGQNDCPPNPKGGYDPPCAPKDGGPSCPAGFCFTRSTIACEQIACPAMAGRTYTEECCCDCWADQTYMNVYDPCRPGYLLMCAPRK